MTAQTESRALIQIVSAEDRNFAGVMECWPPEWKGPFANEVLDMAVAIRSGKVLIAVLRDSKRASPNPDQDPVLGWLLWDDRFCPGSLYVRKAAVRRENRKTGILGLLLTEAVDFGNRAGFRQILADMGPDSLVSEDYARRLGFEPIGQVKGLAAEDYVTTFWRLKPSAGKME
jgi:hypothetical protein